MLSSLARFHALLSLVILAALLLEPASPAMGQEGAAATQDPPTTTPITGPRKLRRYRAVIYGLPQFDCVSIDDLGVAIARANAVTDDPNMPPDVQKYSKILDLKLERRFDMDREFHKWIQAARAGKADPKDGVIMLLDDANMPVVRFKFYQALPKRWEINIPPMNKKEGFVTETVTLTIQDMEMEY